jgi:adenylylsulfate kinase-like enzyme
MSTTIWLHGRPSAGKTTIANKLSEIADMMLLDGDTLRVIIGSDLGYTREDRNKQAKRIIEYRNSDEIKDVSVVLTTNSHFENNRNLFRNGIKNIMEVYVFCPLQECMIRDTKGLYRRALDGEISDLPGIDEEFEEPSRYDVIVDTSTMDVDLCINEILEACLERYFT